MRKRKFHFGKEHKARDFAAESGGMFHENKGNTDKPFTVSFPKERRESDRNENFNSAINENGTNWHTSEDL